MRRHDSQRGWFAHELYQRMNKNPDIYLLVGDLGYRVFDTIRDNCPGRFFNVGAAEQSMMGVAVGLALEGKIPFVYSITNFLLWRPAETINLYLQNEQIPVKLVGSGRDSDYSHDGPSHDATGIESLFYCWPKIATHWPNDKEEIPQLVDQMITSRKPEFISLRR